MFIVVAVAVAVAVVGAGAAVTTSDTTAGCWLTSDWFLCSH